MLPQTVTTSRPTGIADTWVLSLPHWVGCAGLGRTGCRNCPHAAGCVEITDIVMNSRLLTGQCGCGVDHPDNTGPRLPIKCMPSNTQRSAVAAKLGQPRRGSYGEEWFKGLCLFSGSPVFLFSKLVHITGSSWVCLTMSAVVRFHQSLTDPRGRGKLMFIKVNLRLNGYWPNKIQLFLWVLQIYTDQMQSGCTHCFRSEDAPVGL